jgi:hypothetical protein
MGKPSENGGGKKRETNKKENFESKSSLRIHKLSRVKLGKEKEVKPRIEGT